MTDDAGSSSSAIEPDALDPITSERRFYRDPFSGLQREIWRPGDGDGDKATDYFDRLGPPLPVEKRWRLFQSDIGYVHRKNMPPKLVMLDDRAAADVLQSELPRAMLNKFWPHDFCGPGRVRARRTHRGRPSISHDNADGGDTYVSAITGVKSGPLYHFTGEKDYTPVIYRPLPPAPPKEPTPRKRKPEKGDEDYDGRLHGHNQYTPKDMLVKHGAPSFAVNPVNRKKRLNTFLVQDEPPPHAKFWQSSGVVRESARAAAQREEDESAPEDQTGALAVVKLAQNSSIEAASVHTHTDDDQDDESAMDFPVRRPAHLHQPGSVDTLSLGRTVSTPSNVFDAGNTHFHHDLARQDAVTPHQDNAPQVSEELALVMNTVAQQKEEIEHLKQALLHAQDGERVWKVMAEELRASVTKANDEVIGQMTTTEGAEIR